MNNDLISREALKKKFERLVDETIPYGGVAVNDMRELIDNAPAIEYTFEEAFQKTVCEQRLYCPARTQGEWMRLDLAKRVIAKFKGYLDEDMILRIQIALEKEYEAEMQGGAE